MQEEICSDPVLHPRGRAAFAGRDGFVRTAPPPGWGFWSIAAGDVTVVSPLRFSKFGTWRPNVDRRLKNDKYSPIKSSLYSVSIGSGSHVSKNSI